MSGGSSTASAAATCWRPRGLPFAAGLGLLVAAGSEPVVWIAWLIFGVGMGLGLYDAAFAALGRISGETARVAITGVTLFAGFASTIGWLAKPFTILQGAGNGIFTIVRGTVPLSIYGEDNYGDRLGLLGTPGRIRQACKPLGFGLMIETLGVRALIVSVLISLAASVALLAVGRREHQM